MSSMIEKALLGIDDLMADGGQLPATEAKTFIRTMTEQDTIMRTSRVVPMASSTHNLSKIGFGSRILRAANQGEGKRALSENDRSKPTTGRVSLESKEVIAEVRIPYETIEDNIEKGQLTSTIIALIAQHASVDIEEILINGDTDDTDPFLALFDGVLKRANRHTVDATGFDIDSDLFSSTVKSMPKKYRTNKRTINFFLPDDVEQDYRNAQSKRGTNLGDATLTGDAPLRLFSSPAIPVAMLPDDQAIYTPPRNIIVGVQRRITIETDKDISAREVIFVVTARIACAVEEADAIVKIINIGK